MSELIHELRRALKRHNVELPHHADESNLPAVLVATLNGTPDSLTDPGHPMSDAEKLAYEQTSERPMFGLGWDAEQTQDYHRQQRDRHLADAKSSCGAVAEEHRRLANAHHRHLNAAHVHGADMALDMAHDMFNLDEAEQDNDYQRCRDILFRKFRLVLPANVTPREGWRYLITSLLNKRAVKNDDGRNGDTERENPAGSTAQDHEVGLSLSRWRNEDYGVSAGEWAAMEQMTRFANGEEI